VTEIKTEDLVFEIPPIYQRILNRILLYPLLNYALPVGFMRWMIQSSKSELAKEIMKTPGGWRMMRRVYEGEAPKDLIDAAAQRSAFSMAARNRKKLFVRVLAELIRAHEKEGLVEIVGVGTGPATNAIEAMAESGVENVKAYCIEMDDAAFEYGRELAERFGVAEKIEYIQGDAREVAPHVAGSPCIAKLLGIIEYLTDEQVLELFQVMRGALREGGHIVVNEISPRHALRRFTERISGWSLVYRDSDQISDLLGRAGFKTTFGLRCTTLFALRCKRSEARSSKTGGPRRVAHM